METPLAAPSAADFLREHLQAVDRCEIAFVTVPAPVARLDALLGLARNDAPLLLWDPPGGDAGFAAFGAAETIVGAGRERFAAVREQASALWERTRIAALGQDAPLPRCIGGFAFESGGARDEPWREFGDARFVLPRFGYHRAQSAAWLAVAVRGDELADAAAREALVARAAAILDALQSAGRAPPPVSPPYDSPPLAVDQMSTLEWGALVDGIKAAIAGGRIDKVVAARRRRLHFAEPIDPISVLASLAANAEHATRFCLRFGTVSFVGSTPEQLVKKRGLSVHTEALAGTHSPEADGEEGFLADRKELAEHAFVLNDILRSLEPLCTRLEHPAQPDVRRLRHLLHLRTPVMAELARQCHVLDLAERLHPTPAVAGVPTRVALEWIREHERLERGWYAAPVGWFDAAGDGELAVALRSGALEGRTAHLFAGAGIVRGSAPDDEYAETELKLASLSSALCPR